MTMKQYLPTRHTAQGKEYGTGYLTPKSIQTEQIICFSKPRVIPIIFLPGVMGSNLRISSKKALSRLNKDNDIAWRPDWISESVHLISEGPDERQVQLNPETTEVDRYDPAKPEAGMARSVDVTVVPGSDMLLPDPPNQRNAKTSRMKALERGWGEVFWGSYGELLNALESNLNQPHTIWASWKSAILNRDPSEWQAAPTPTLAPLTPDDLQQVLQQQCNFPVHAIGYNWLRSNGDEAKVVAQRIEQIIASYQHNGKQCEKVIVVTHSMGGLLARALIHPAYGNLQDKVLGMVHSVMPALGSATAYRRVRGGIEGGEFDPTRRVIGKGQAEVTAVFANAQGPLELLPTEAYGNGWLRFKGADGHTIQALPQHGDPYREIYLRQDVWWRLIQPELINPAKLGDSNIENTNQLLKNAQQFTRAIAGHYHPLSYAHYGCDRAHMSWHQLTWQFDNRNPSQAQLKQLQPLQKALAPGEDTRVAFPNPGDDSAPLTFAAMLPAESPGDGTVPMASADDQAHSGHFSGIFRQTGYDHQSSYQNDKVLLATLYSIIRIAQKMHWSST